ncbi:hypothetical protein AFAE65S_00225 [Alcaligenes phenolicus]
MKIYEIQKSYSADMQVFNVRCGPRFLCLDLELET